MMRFDLIFSDGIEHCPKGNQKQADSLDRAHPVFVGKHLREILEHHFSCHAAERRADGKRRSGFHIHQGIPAQFCLYNGVTGHRQHGAARQKADGRDAQHPERIQKRLDQHAPADPADRAHHRRAKTNGKKNHI